MSLDRYSAVTGGVADGLKYGRNVLDGIGAAVTAGQAGMFVYGKSKDFTDGVPWKLDAVKYTLAAVNVVSPLKAPIKVLQAAVTNVERPVETIKEVQDRLDGITLQSTLDQRQTFNAIFKVKDFLAAMDFSIALVRDPLTVLISGLELASRGSTNQYHAMNGNLDYHLGRLGIGASAAEDPAAQSTSTEGWAFADLQAGLDAESAVRIDRLVAVTPQVTAVNEAFENLLGIFDRIDFDSINLELSGVEEIGKLLDKLKVPLDIALNAIDPIRPLLDAIGLVSQLVDSVVDFIVESLGLGGLMDAAEEAIADLLPPIDLLDAFFDLIKPLVEGLEQFIDNALGAFDMMDAVTEAAFGNGFGDALNSFAGWSNDLDNVLRGDEGDDALDALGGDDTIYGGAGNDVIVAGTGDDEIWGEAGDDFIHFNASFTGYELARERLPGDTDQATGDIVVSHVRPFGTFNTGVDILRDLDDGDIVAFTDIAFTGAELKSAFIGGSVLTGSARNDLMFLNSTGTRIDGYYVAEGLEGDDRIFGSTGDDRLIGGAGNDVLLPGLGDDEALGGTGDDTFQVLAGSLGSLRVDLGEGTAFGQGSDTLVDIENVILQPGQKHFVRGTDDPNAIYTADGQDVITGRGGSDFIRTGGEDDFIVAGAGADTIDAGSGRDVMISGSAAALGVTDTYIGGDGFDVVSYTGESTTIRDDVNAVNDDPSILQTVKNYMAETAASGRVEIDGTTGRIARFDADGTQVATDETDGVEGFMGSDVADLLVGGPVASWLHGAGGDDVIRTNGTEHIFGGRGDDLILAQRVDGGATQLQIDGGQGEDRLELDGVGPARWFYRVESSIALTLRAFEIGTEGEDLRNTPNAFFSIKPRDVEAIKLGDYADHAIYEPGGTRPTTFELGGGDDRFDGENGFAEVFAAEGDDIGNFDRGGGGIFHGGAGADFSVWSDTTRENAALMGAGTDRVVIKRFFGHADGGDGFDTIGFDVAFLSRIVADLGAGTVESFKGQATINAEQVGMTLEGFEQFIATGFNDRVTGSGADERIVGRDGRDTLNGAGGADELYGGSGDDSILGGDGDDILHGGAGSDILDGGAGVDMASYVWAQPDGLDGGFVTTGFSGVTVDLGTGSALGAFGSDTLRNIENVAGGAGDDALTGDGADNILSGGQGDDTLVGGDGADVLITGSGSDLAIGGAGDDRIVVDLGTAESLVGGTGDDTLDFGLLDGLVDVDLEAGTYSAQVETLVARWGVLDVDGDGTDDGDGFEARLIGGDLLTPDDVLRTDPLFSRDPGDLARNLPEPGEDGFLAAQIEQVIRTFDASGGFTGIERVRGGLSDDNVRGSRSADWVAGGEGADTLDGGDGNDTLDGGQGADLIYGGAGSDSLTGGAGPGADWITPGGGDDTVDGGEGNDMVSFSDLGETPGRTNLDYRLTIDLEAGTAVSHDGAERMSLLNLERVTGTIFADFIRGDAGANQLRGLGDYDWFLATTGPDTIDGGNGQDMISFVEWQNAAANTIGDAFGPLPPSGAQATGIYLDLTNPANNTNLAAGLELTSIERITGSGRQDVFFGDDQSNDFRGLGDFDWFVSSDGGRERYFGGDGDDTVTYFNAPGAVTA
ncbi:Ca2+-binding protein, RTX toxin-related, partial [Palleronia salina]